MNIFKEFNSARKKLNSSWNAIIIYIMIIFWILRVPFNTLN